MFHSCYTDITNDVYVGILRPMVPMPLDRFYFEKVYTELSACSRYLAHRQEIKRLIDEWRETPNVPDIPGDTDLYKMILQSSLLFESLVDYLSKYDYR